MDRLETRNDIRTNNQIQILEILRRRDRTITDIANHLKISFTAASNIIDEMQQEGLVKVTAVTPIKASRGRIPNYVSINLDKGIVCAIDLSSPDINVVIATLNCNIIAIETIKNAIFITQEHLEQVELLIKKMLASPEVADKKLLSICIASPGLIRRDNFEYADVFRIPNFKNINPVLFFKNAFNVDVEMHNDIRIACLAELKNGAFPKRPFNGLFVHIGTSCGLCLLIDGKIYKGTNNFSGELIAETGDKDIEYVYRLGQLQGFWEILCSINKETKIGDPLNMDKIIEDFNNNDPNTREAVIHSCKLNALTLAALSALMDVETIVIEGPILKFGEEYLNMLRKYTLLYSPIEMRARICSSITTERNSILGACYQATSIYLSNSIEKMARKRLDQPSFELDKSFKDL